VRPLSEIYRQLVAAGATPEVIALAIEAFESGGQSGKSGGRADTSQADLDAYERRKAWDREYRAKRRADRESGGQSGKSGGKSGGHDAESGGQPLSPPSAPLVPPLSPAPLSPPIIPPPSAPLTVRANETLDLEPIEVRGVAALRAEAVTRKAAAGRWDEFQAAYPKREGSQSWPAAEKKFVALVASGIAEEAIIAGAHDYARHLEATGQVGTRYVKQALTWLNQQGWKDEYLVTGKTGQSDLMDACNARIRQAKDRRSDLAPDQGGDYWARPEDDPVASY